MLCDNSEYIEIDGACYRKNVGIIIYNCEGKVLLCERNQEKIDYKWQFPQGGVDNNEKTEDTALRELFEETGIKSAKIVFKDNVWRAYKFPAILKFSRKHHDYYKNVKGQIQKWKKEGGSLAKPNLGKSANQKKIPVDLCNHRYFF